MAQPTYNQNRKAGKAYGATIINGKIVPIGADGKPLVDATGKYGSVEIRGGETIYKNPDGSVAQMVGPQGRVFNPVSGLSDLPAGSYDPAIDYESGAANRGLGYQQQDYGTNYATPKGVSLHDLLTGSANPTDLNAQDAQGNYLYGRGIRDYFLNRGRENENYTTATADLNRGYQQQGQNQLQAINQSGLLEGGALAQSLAKRTANQAHDQGGLDVNHNRSLADLLTGTERGGTDAYTTLQRAVGENAPYQATLLTQAAQQAAPAFADDPNYEVHNGVTYVRQPAGSLKPVTRKTKLPKYDFNNPSGLPKGLGPNTGASTTTF